LDFEPLLTRTVFREPHPATTTTITLGVDNVMDLSPPFVDGEFENGYDERQANIRGRVWYVALKKRF